MLRYMVEAGDTFEIMTFADSEIPQEKLPETKFGYKVEHTQGFTFPLYNVLTLSLDLPDLKEIKVLNGFKPDVIHVSSP